MAGAEDKKKDESKPLSVKDMLKNLEAVKVGIEAINTPTRESSLSLTHLNNAIYWLKKHN